jgi:hypothetical protein
MNNLDEKIEKYIDEGIIDTFIRKIHGTEDAPKYAAQARKFHDAVASGDKEKARAAKLEMRRIREKHPHRSVGYTLRSADPHSTMKKRQESHVAQ